jgi:hypothetical protein
MNFYAEKKKPKIIKPWSLLMKNCSNKALTLHRVNIKESMLISLYNSRVTFSDHVCKSKEDNMAQQSCRI